MNQIEKTVLYTAEDLQWAYSLHYKKKYPIRSRLMVIMGVIALSGGIALVLYSFLIDSTRFSSWISWFFICYGVLILVLYYLNFKNIGKRLYARSTDFHKPFRYFITPEKLEVNSENINGSHSWSYYTSAIISKEFILLYINQYRFNFLLKKHFTEQEFEIMTHWVSSKINTKFM